MISGHARITLLVGTMMLVLLSKAQVATQPRLLSFAIPNYPPLAQFAGKSGDVELEIKLDAECKVSQVIVLRADPLFLDSVKTTASKWRFSSCMRESKQVRAKFTFRVQGESNDWTPTDFEMTSPWVFVITTAHPDWNFQ